jgi:hypothetical protein
MRYVFLPPAAWRRRGFGQTASPGAAAGKAWMPCAMSSPPLLRYGGAGGYGKTMLAKALAHNAPPQTMSLPLRHVWRKTNNCGCSVSTNTLARDGMPMDFLLSHFTLLGVDLQWWMPILGG